MVKLNREENDRYYYQLQYPAYSIEYVRLPIVTVVVRFDALVLWKISVGLGSQDSIAGSRVPSRSLFFVESPQNGARSNCCGAE